MNRWGMSEVCNLGPFCVNICNLLQHFWMLNVIILKMFHLIASKWYTYGLKYLPIKMVAPYKCFHKLLFYVYINAKELRLQNYHKGGYIIYQYTRSNKAWCILEHCIVKKQFEEDLLINWLKQCRNNPVYKMHEIVYWTCLATCLSNL